jgi:CheY-like chemotaxis protein
VNARDAMPEGGTLTLRAENCVLDETTAGQIKGSRPGSFLVLHVQDTGTGIPQEILAHMWEPFFTTKDSGKGTGLGLSTVRGIVESHAGFATVSSIDGKGTTFRIYLPAAEKGPNGTPTAEESVAPAPRGRNELILLVDDEAGIRNMAATILTSHGYRVLTASDGAEAISIFAPRSEEITLLITDLGMPNLGGAALAGVVQRLNPNVKILAVSGLAADASGAPAFAHAFLIKPFGADALLTAVSNVLGSVIPK